MNLTDLNEDSTIEKTVIKEKAEYLYLKGAI